MNEKGGKSIWAFIKEYKSYIIIALVFFLLLCFSRGNNLMTWIAAMREIKIQERQIRAYQKDIMRMDSTINILTTNRDSLEKFAREHFHFAEKDEDIYLIDE